MKLGLELVKVGLRVFFENVVEDLEKISENLKFGKFIYFRTQIKGVFQNINYIIVVLFFILTFIFEYVVQYQFGVDLFCELDCRLLWIYMDMVIDRKNVIYLC